MINQSSESTMEDSFSNVTVISENVQLENRKDNSSDSPVQEVEINGVIRKAYMELIPLIAANYTPITSEPVDNIISRPEPLFIVFKHLMKYFIESHVGTRVHIHYTFERKNNDLYVYLDGMGKSRFSLRPDVRTKEFHSLGNESLENEDIQIAKEMLPHLAGKIYESKDNYTRSILIKISVNLESKIG